MTKQEKIYAQAQSGTPLSARANKAQSTQTPINGQLTIVDILNNYDEGTYGKPVEEYEVK